MKLCDEGQSFNLELGVCEDEKSVDCLTRTKKWRIVPSKTKKIRLFGELNSISSTTRTPVVVTTTSPSTSTTATAVADSVVHHDPLLEAECETDGGVYVVPDPLHCDRYLVCPAKSVELCEAGEVLDTKTGYCAPRARVQCGDRKLNMRNIQVWSRTRLLISYQAFTAGTVGGEAGGEGEGNCPGNRGDQLVPLHLHHHQTSRGYDSQTFTQELWNPSAGEVSHSHSRS